MCRVLLLCEVAPSFFLDRINVSSEALFLKQRCSLDEPAPYLDKGSEVEMEADLCS